MARKSKARRDKAKLVSQEIMVKSARSAYHAIEAAMLQQGSPTNTSRAKFDRMTGHGSAPRGLSLEGNGQAKRKVARKSRLTGEIAVSIPDLRLGTSKGA